jgi:hypothetical protein
MLDITNQKFNKLTAITYIGDEKWLFECECGTQVAKKASDVKRGKTTSCSRVCTTGNPSKHPLYQTWDGIKKRCYQENATGYKNYGGRGIKMCKQWKTSFWQFVEDMGNKPFEASTIDRIDNSKDYSKDNCVWATKQQQAQNRRNNIYINYNGKTHTLYSICKELNITHSTTYWRLKKSKLDPQKYFDKYIF